MVRIANPIYDVVFKYLLSDNKIAKLLIAAIIGEEVIELEFKCTEHQSELESRNLLVYRLDFSAKIRQADGSDKLVLIEIQKAKLATDIMRFRRYLASQYADQNNIVAEQANKYHALPIITIYFLGHKLEHTTAPVIKVRREYRDVSTGKLITEKESFIESLTHDSFIIQIPFLAEHRASELEKILSVFDQSMVTRDKHVIALNENDYPEKYRDVIRRLLKAVAEPEVRETMTIEDELLEELESLERSLQQKDEQLIEKDEQLSEKAEQLSKKAEQLSEKAEQLSEKDEQLAEKDEQLEHAVTVLMDKLNITREAAVKIIDKKG